MATPIDNHLSNRTLRHRKKCLTILFVFDLSLSGSCFGKAHIRGAPGSNTDFSTETEHTGFGNFLEPFFIKFHDE